MTHEAWILIAGIVLSNLLALTTGLLHISARLARIETDIKWIKAGCDRCEPTFDK